MVDRTHHIHVRTRDAYRLYIISRLSEQGGHARFMILIDERCKETCRMEGVGISLVTDGELDVVKIRANSGVASPLDVGA